MGELWEIEQYLNLDFKPKSFVTKIKIYMDCVEQLSKPRRVGYPKGKKVWYSKRQK